MREADVCGGMGGIKCERGTYWRSEGKRGKETTGEGAISLISGGKVSSCSGGLFTSAQERGLIENRFASRYFQGAIHHVGKRRRSK